MKLGNFTLNIVGGHDLGDRVTVPHGGVYKVRLTSTHWTRADVDLKIDGKHVGSWRLNAYGSITLDTPEAASAGIQSGGELNGLVQATFRPEKVRELPKSSVSLSSVSLDSHTFGGDVTRGVSGGTGLSGHSSQNFGTTASITDYDHEQTTTISVRLHCPSRMTEPRPLQAAGGNPVPARPLQAAGGNPVPARVDRLFHGGE